MFRRGSPSHLAPASVLSLVSTLAGPRSRALALSAALAVSAALALSACSKAEEPPPGAVPTSHAADSAKAPAPPPRPATKPAAEVAFDAPASWTKSDKPNPMRKATYLVPRAPGDAEDGELAISVAGGTVELNITRWRGQFDKSPEPVITKKQAGDLKITEVELKGTFAGGGMPGMAPSEPKQNFAMLAAIVETPSGLQFFKMTGPQKTLAAAKPDFEKLLDSLRLK